MNIVVGMKVQIKEGAKVAVVNKLNASLDEIRWSQSGTCTGPITVLTAYVTASLPRGTNTMGLCKCGATVFFHSEDAQKYFDVDALKREEAEATQRLAMAEQNERAALAEYNRIQGRANELKANLAIAQRAWSDAQKHRDEALGKLNDRRGDLRRARDEYSRTQTNLTKWRKRKNQ